MRLTVLGGCAPVQPSWDGLRELLYAQADLTKCLQRPHAVR